MEPADWRIYYIEWNMNPVSLNEIKRIAAKENNPVKFYDEQGFLKGTAYPNGEVQR